jgi:hypothetical protein
MTPAALALPAVTPIVAAIRMLYGIGDDINRWADRHIAELKRSRNPNISRTGRVLEAAKKGFGIAYISSATIIAAGQLLLGHPIDAGTTAITAMIDLNPHVLTAAAIGALMFGYSALNEDERAELHRRVGSGLAIGIELVRSVIEFAIKAATSLLGNESWDDFKRFFARQKQVLGEAFESAGKSISEGYDSFSDWVRSLFGSKKKPRRKRPVATKPRAGGAARKKKSTAQSARRRRSTPKQLPAPQAQPESEAALASQRSSE